MIKDSTHDRCIICINNPATRRESGKWSCKIVTFYRIICPRRSHKAGTRISRVTEKKNARKVEYLQNRQTNAFYLLASGKNISKGYSRIRSRMRDYHADKTRCPSYIFKDKTRVKSREIDFTSERESYIWLRHRKCLGNSDY